MEWPIYIPASKGFSVRTINPKHQLSHNQVPTHDEVLSSADSTSKPSGDATDSHRAWNPCLRTPYAMSDEANLLLKLMRSKEVLTVFSGEGLTLQCMVDTEAASKYLSPPEVALRKSTIHERAALASASRRETPWMGLPKRAFCMQLVATSNRILVDA